MRKSSVKQLAALLSLAVIFAFTACEDFLKELAGPETGKTIAVKGISITGSKTRSLKVGEEGIQLEWTITPDDASNKKVNWESSDERKVRVNDGFLTAGTGIKITVKTAEGDFEDTVTVTVMPDGSSGAGGSGGGGGDGIGIGF